MTTNNMQDIGYRDGPDVNAQTTSFETCADTTVDTFAGLAGTTTV